MENQICGVNIGNTKSLFEKAQDSASKSGSSKIFLRIMRLLAVIPTAFSLSHTVWEEVERAIAETVLPNVSDLIVLLDLIRILRLRLRVSSIAGRARCEKGKCIADHRAGQ